LEPCFPESHRKVWFITASMTLARTIEELQLLSYQALPFARLHRALYFAPRLPILDVLAPVVFVFAFAQSDFELRLPRRREIKPQGDQCQPLLLGPAHELIDLPAMQEQLSRAQRVVIHDVAVTVGANVAVVQNHLGPVHPGETVPQVDKTFTNGFDFGALQRHARLVALLNVVIVKGLAIRGHHGLGLFALLCHAGPRQTRCQSS